ncbi:MAG: TonB-dependent receptor [Acidobacteria bacterium]|nr:TonB-dependent receptor [Acidobacteriota bacterium]
MEGHVPRIFGSLCRAMLCSLCIFFAIHNSLGQEAGSRGIVVNEKGAPVIKAKLTVHSPQGTVLRELFTDEEGGFSIGGLPFGSYTLEIEADEFQKRQVSLESSPAQLPQLKIVLSLAPFRSEVTITANRGAATEIETSAPLVTARDQTELRARPLATIGNALEGNAGIMVQQSTYGQVSPFLRGLTGYQALNLIDGVRFNNSTFRSGPNQYLAFIEPGQAQRIEAMLGPASSQYGSDALGGTIQLLTLSPTFSDRNNTAINFEAQTFAASADASFGADVKISMGTQRIAWLIGADGRRHNDLRAGGGDDSRHVFRRFFGLSNQLIRELHGARQQDTGFSQYGWHTKLASRLSEDQNLTLWYQASTLDRVRGYKDLWGGLGRLRSDFDPQGLQFFYARYENLKLGFLDSFTGTFSINSQSDGSIRQGLRATDPIIRDESLVNSFGYATQATTHIGDRNALVIGGEIYNERIGAFRDETDPRLNVPVEKRALYPNGSRYTTYGLFAQDTLDILRGKLRANFGGRLTRVSFRTFADRNLDAFGKNLGVVDASQNFDDVTFNANLSWQVTNAIALNFLTGRGFRAPNLNDLGALGLNDLGYEIPAATAEAVGGLIGVSDGEGVASSGKSVSALRAERLFNFELAATLKLSRLYLRAHVFDAELKEPIVRRTLLFPANSAPATLAGLPVTPIPQTPAQREQNVRSVATALDPRAVKAFVNEGEAKYYGIETIFRYAISTRWFAEGNYSYLVGRELNPNRFIRRLPPQQGFLAIRFQPNARKLHVNWLELSGIFSGAQERLSGGDITDERIGAARRRRDITDFFQGSIVGPFIKPGADGTPGTADDLFAPTNETVAQIRDRVLPIGATINGLKIVDDNTRVPLYTQTAGFVALNLRSSIVIAENVSLNVALMNFLDRNYRVHGSGVDAPGINVFIGLRFSF